ncbi:MAG: hypothetical protein QOK39_1771 [Acidimicrobiaceae bacterium]|jgi:hypothetical protein|nr:hypothetical protein [Acidimicrobiaceae bacterium]
MGWATPLLAPRDRGLTRYLRSVDHDRDDPVPATATDRTGVTAGVLPVKVASTSLGHGGPNPCNPRW